jgi:hypothetical protein
MSFFKSRSNRSPEPLSADGMIPILAIDLLKFLQTSLGLLVALATLAGCSHSVIPASPSAAIRFSIQLQEGFDGRETIIAVNGRGVYKGRPRTDPRLGLAAAISAGATSTHTVVTLAIPSRRIRWSQRFDLSAGHAVGISVFPSGSMEVHQASKFEYE